MPRRLTPFRLAPAFGVHPDAQGFGHVACLALLNSVCTHHLHLPKWFAGLATNTEGESAIYLFEICAAILAVTVVSQINTEPSRTCVICIDNRAALDALVKGSTSSELGANLVGVFWAIAARSSVYWWLEYVHTDSNDADHPSRCCSADTAPQCLSNSGLTPDAFARAFQSWEALRRASTRL